MSDARLAETIEYTALRRLQNAYADVVTRRAWPELGELFLPDAVIDVDTRRGEPLQLNGPRALGTFIGDSIERFAFFEFVILNTHIEIDVAAGTATGRMYMCELRQDRDSGQWTNAFGLYQDRFTRRDDRWWFEHRQYHSLARTAPATEVFSFPPLQD